jgi:hypothetical protein
MRISEAYRPVMVEGYENLFFGVYTWTPKPPKGKNDKPAADASYPDWTSGTGRMIRYSAKTEDYIITVITASRIFSHGTLIRTP